MEQKNGGEFVWGGWLKPYQYILGEAAETITEGPNTVIPYRMIMKGLRDAGSPFTIQFVDYMGQVLYEYPKKIDPVQALPLHMDGIFKDIMKIRMGRWHRVNILDKDGKVANSIAIYDVPKKRMRKEEVDADILEGSYVHSVKELQDAIRDSRKEIASLLKKKQEASKKGDSKSVKRIDSEIKEMEDNISDAQDQLKSMKKEEVETYEARRESVGSGKWKTVASRFNTDLAAEKWILSKGFKKIPVEDWGEVGYRKGNAHAYIGKDPLGGYEVRLKEEVEIEDGFVVEETSKIKLVKEMGSKTLYQYGSNFYIVSYSSMGGETAIFMADSSGKPKSYESLWSERRSVDHDSAIKDFVKYKFKKDAVVEAYGNPFTPQVPGTFAAPNFNRGLKAGDKVKVPHKGKMVSGKIVRYDDGGTEKARQHGGAYVVDVGEYASIRVPAHEIVKEEVEVTEAKEKFLTGPSKKDPKRLLGIYTTKGKWIKDMNSEKEASAFVSKSWGESVEVAEAATPAVPTHGYKVGDILYSSYGYNMTIPQFFKITRLIGATKVEVVELGQTRDGDGWYGNAMPSSGTISQPKVFTVRRSGGANPGIKINSSATASKWDGRPKYYNTLD